MIYVCEKAADSMVSGLPGEIPFGMKRPLAPVLAGSIAADAEFVESEMLFPSVKHRRRCGGDTASSRALYCAALAQPSWNGYGPRA